MAEPRKVQFVTLSAFAAGAAADSRKRRLEDEADFSFAQAEVEAVTRAGGAAASNGRLGKTGDRDKTGAEKRETLRFNLPLSEPDERSSAEFNYGELIQSLQVGSHSRCDYEQEADLGCSCWTYFIALQVSVWTCHC